MSTPDNNSDKGPALPPTDGVNPYKVNRTGLVPPTLRKAPSQALRLSVTDVHTGPRFRLWQAFALLAGLVVVVTLGILWGLNRQVSAPRPEGVSGTARVRGEGERSATLPSYRALVIGVNQYQQAGGEGWQILNSARADAEAIARTLASDYGFKVQTLLDGEATRAAILNALDELATTGADGADLIYFAGHGYFDDKLQEGYWIPADARKAVGGRQAKEDWLWNSTLTRLISASRARHVLVLSDACYSGSLFRGDEPLSTLNNQAWYGRAIAKPSRYLITSGGLEPVLDSGAGHSVFAQQVINYLEHSDRSVFSANDLGSALRERVAALTGQMVQMGPLPVSGHAGGEFVFVRQKAGVLQSAFMPQTAGALSETDTRGPDQASDATSRQTAIRSAVALTRAGAPKAASNLISTVLQQNAQDHLALTVADYIARSQKQEGRDDLRKLIEQIETKGKEAATAADSGKASGARPRVIACLGPVLPADGNPAAEGVALLYRIALRAELETCAGLKVIEREALETLLQEQNLGVSDLADPRSRLAIGKLLPASLLLLGDVLPSGQGDKLFLRLVDTETTQVLASFTAMCKADEDQEKVCADLASRIAERVTTLKPLLAPVTGVEDTRLRAGLGTCQGVRAGLSFSILSRTLRDKKVPDDFTEQEVGAATVRSASDYSCELDAVWGAGTQPRAQDLWIRERPAALAATP
ncbi:MAG: caspase family protein [bacterium]